MSLLTITCDDELHRLLERDYLHRQKLKLRSNAHIVPVYCWCVDQFGPSAKKYRPVGMEIDLECGWLSYTSDFYFRDPDEAMWFRFRWG